MKKDRKRKNKYSRKIEKNFLRKISLRKPKEKRRKDKKKLKGYTREREHTGVAPEYSRVE